MRNERFLCEKELEGLPGLVQFDLRLSFSSCCIPLPFLGLDL